TPVLRQMVERFERTQRTIVAVQPIPMADSASYGIIRGEAAGEGLYKMTAIVEKPRPEVAPSNLAVVGRYMLTPAVMNSLEKVSPGAGGEIQLTDAIASVLKPEGAFGYEFEGRRFDCGSKIGYLEANVMYALKHAEVSKEFCEFLSKLEAERKG